MPLKHGIAERNLNLEYVVMEPNVAFVAKTELCMSDASKLSSTHLL